MKILCYCLTMFFMLLLLDTGITRCPSAGHSCKRNQENFGKMLFMANPLGVLFTESRRGML